MSPASGSERSSRRELPRFGRSRLVRLGSWALLAAGSLAGHGCGRLGYDLLSENTRRGDSGTSREAGSGGNVAEASPGSGGSTGDSSGSSGGGNATDSSTPGSGGRVSDSAAGTGGSVSDSSGLNTPPLVRLVVTPGLGEPSTVFTSDSTGITDREDPPSALRYSWDWENDGAFDAEGPTATHVYASAGTHTVVLRATDTGGLSGYETFDVVVVPPDGLVIVTTAADESDPSATPANAIGTGLSLREAIAYANATAGRQSILVPKGMTIALSSALPATADGAGTDVVADGAVVDGSGNKCIDLGGAGDRLFGLELRACGGAGIRLLGANVQVARTYIHDNSGPVDTLGVCHFGPGNEIAFQNEGLTLHSQCIVEHNRVHDCGSYGIRAITGGPGSAFRFNVSYRNGHGLALSSQIDSASIVHNVLAFNSGAVSGGGGGIQLGGTNHEVRNNILAFNGTYGLDARSATFLMEDHNGYFSNTSGACAGCTPGAGTATMDPRFIDSTSGDYRLFPANPLVDAAVNLGLDVNGPEPGLFNGAAPDLGAWEAPASY